MLERFWSKVDKSGNCWIWKAAKNDRGYGVFATIAMKSKKNFEYAHRVSWCLFHKIPMPKHPIIIDHKCFNSECVNPDHLQLMHHSENAAQHARNLDMKCKKCGSQRIRRPNKRIICRPCEAKYQRERKKLRRLGREANPTGCNPV